MGCVSFLSLSLIQNMYLYSANPSRSTNDIDEPLNRAREKKNEKKNTCRSRNALYTCAHKFNWYSAFESLILICAAARGARHNRTGRDDPILSMSHAVVHFRHSSCQSTSTRHPDRNGSASERESESCRGTVACSSLRNESSGKCSSSEHLRA